MSEGQRIRINIAFRRLQIALLRSGYEFDGDSLEAAVKAASHIVEAHPIGARLDTPERLATGRDA